MFLQYAICAQFACDLSALSLMILRSRWDSKSIQARKESLFYVTQNNTL